MGIIPIYSAISVSSVLSEDVGHTKPWIVIVNANGKPTPYVAKLFSPEQVDNQFRVVKEVVGNILASEFELSVPSIALIDIPQDVALKQTTNQIVQFEESDPKFKFATLYVDGITARSTLPRDKFKKHVDIDTLYGFDNVIRNRDRGQVKPNLLFTKGKGYLIDHELCLDNNSISETDINNVILEDRFTKHHLCYSYLRKTRSDKKSSLFEDFEYFLENMSITKLNPYLNQLESEGYPMNRDTVTNWLQLIKGNSRIFVDKLKSSL